jgi:ubiquinone/menaquinone biosynthesis C-methylase UbiE
MSHEARRLQGVYRRWAPVYDRLLGRMFRDARRRSIDALALRPDDRVLLSGVGTGLDVPLLPPVARIVALDFTREMLLRVPRGTGGHLDPVLGDAQRLPLRDASFDAAVLHLILAVAPDGRAVLSEACRAVRPGGRIAVFDKFASEGGASPLRSALNRVTRLAGTAIDRRFGAMSEGLPLRVERDEAALRGAYRVMMLERT